MFTIQTHIDVITSPTTLTDAKYGGWFAKNTGAVNATVLGVPLAPGEVFDQFVQLAPDVLWTQPIQIVPDASGEVTLIRTIYNRK